MLCAICIKIFHSSDLSGDHHQGFDDVEKAANNGCKICRHVRLSFPSWPPKKRLRYEIKAGRGWRTGFLNLTIGIKNPMGPIFIHVSRADKFPDGYTEFLGIIHRDLDTDPCRVRADFPPQRPIADSTGHESVAALAKTWLETCKREHKCEQMSRKRQAGSPGWVPSRLIKVGRPDEQPRLVLSEEEQVDGGYASLSHCWGACLDFLKLTASNIEDLCKGIPMASLPASFQDAILICRRLGIPYLWIDSLCILQSGSGSESDWQANASGQMSRIYSCCDLNIAIDVAGSPEEGAFRARDPRFLQDCYVWTPHAHLSPSEGLHASANSKPLDRSCSNPDVKIEGPTHPTDASPHSANPEQSPQIYLYAIFTKDDFSSARLDLPLTKRAWVLQELLLSPRTLHFQTDRISWQCEERQCLTEYLHDSQATNCDKRGFDCLYQTEYNLSEEAGDDWYSYQRRVAEYTDRSLSHPDKDKLVAFSAIAEHYSRFLGEEYCAGVFSSTMPVGLLWNVNAVPPIMRARKYRAPSWSWASVDDRVYSHTIMAAGKGWSPRHTTTLLAKVEDVTIDLADKKNRFGQVKAASLTISGPLISWIDVIGIEEYADWGRVGSAEDLPQDPPDTLYGQIIIVKTGLGLSMWLYPDELGPKVYRRIPWATEAESVFIMPAVNLVPDVEAIEKREVHRPEEEKKNGPIPEPKCVGLVLKRLLHGQYMRLGIWTAHAEILDKYRETGTEIRERSIVII